MGDVPETSKAEGEGAQALPGPPAEIVGAGQYFRNLALAGVALVLARILHAIGLSRSSGPVNTLPCRTMRTLPTATTSSSGW